jgi:hypothetical protein
MLHSSNLAALPLIFTVTGTQVFEVKKSFVVFFFPFYSLINENAVATKKSGSFLTK